MRWPPPLQSMRSISACRSSATARAACSGWSRWSRSRPHPGRIAYGPVTAADVASLVAAKFHAGGNHTLSPRQHRGPPLSEEPGAPHLRALRHHRSGLGRRLRAAWRLRGPEEGAGHGGRGHRRRGHRVGPARPRRRGLPHRHQVEDGARREGRPEIHLLQRRRGRQRHLRRPHGDGGRSPHAHRGHDHRRHRRRRHQGLRLYPLGISRCHRHHEGGDRRRRRRRTGWAPIFRVRTNPSTSRCAAAPAPISAAKRPRCWKASRASAAWCAPSRRSRRSKACSASPPSSTTC